MPMQFLQEDWDDRHPDYVRCELISRDVLVTALECECFASIVIWLPRLKNERLYECSRCGAVFTEYDRFPELFSEPVLEPEERTPANRWQRIAHEIGKVSLILLVWIAAGCHDFASLSSEYARAGDAGVDSLSGVDGSGPDSAPSTDGGLSDSGGMLDALPIDATDAIPSGPCDPRDPNACGAGNGCYLDYYYATNPTCSVAGTHTLGQLCSGNIECVPGFVCVNQRCKPICANPSPNCPTGQACYPLCTMGSCTPPFWGWCE